MNPKAFYSLSYGLYIITSKMNQRFNGQAANAVMQISNDPSTVALSINKDNLTHDFIRESGFAAISILQQDTPLSYIGHFGFQSGRDVDKFKDIEYTLDSNGVPYATEHALACMGGPVIGEMDANTHRVFLCKITDARVLREGPPMTYAYYHEVKKGTTPKAAPTAVIQDEDERGDSMDKFVCTVCGYVYNPQEGDPEGDIPAGTPFEQLPEDWTCPVCGADKDAFEKTD